MTNNLDTFDASGLLPGNAPWSLTPDAGMEASGWNAPRYGGDVTNTTAYPSLEPRAAAQWPRTDQAVATQFSADPVRAGNDMRRSTKAEGLAPTELPRPWKG